MPRPRASRALACLGLALLPLLTGFPGHHSAGAQGAPFYTVTDLGVLGSTASTDISLFGVRSLTDAGNMAINYPDATDNPYGYVMIGGQTVPVPIDLPNRVLKINDDGIAVGRSGQPAVGAEVDFASYRAFTYQDGVVTELPPLEGGVATSALGINERGVVVGTSDIEGGSLAPGDGQRAVSWKNGKATSLGTLGGSWSNGYDINDDGAIVGVSTMEGDEDAVHPFIYRSRKDVTDLGTLGGSCYQRFRINASGQAAGACALEEGDALAGINDYTVHAALWDGEELIDLGTLPESTDSVAYDLNDDGLVVGVSFVPTGEVAADESELLVGRAVVWIDGACVDLNAQIDPGLGIVLDAATAINDQGQIAALGYATSSGQTSIYLLTPSA